VVDSVKILFAFIFLYSETPFEKFNQAAIRLESKTLVFHLTFKQHGSQDLKHTEESLRIICRRREQAEGDQKAAKVAQVLCIVASAALWFLVIRPKKLQGG
jgi:hypothetical protein